MKHVETNKVQFEGELIQGHKGVTVVLVPFDPEEKWSLKPVRLVGRRHGWVVAASANGVAFDGYIGERWNRFFIIIEKNLREAAKLSLGDTLKMTVQPTSSAGALAKALAAIQGHHSTENTSVGRDPSARKLPAALALTR